MTLESLIAQVDEMARLREAWRVTVTQDSARARTEADAIDSAMWNLDWQSLSAVLRELREDAERYRWLRAGHKALAATVLDASLEHRLIANEALDAAIDRARNVKEEGR
jgi:hypothetical protein